MAALLFALSMLVLAIFGFVPGITTPYRGLELAGEASILRVRAEEGRGALVTFKGPTTYEGAVKVRPELELRVESAATALALFEALGYHVERRYQKLREEWRLGAEVICLDHTPIGDFVEFEGEKATAVAKRCGFDPAGAVRKSYLMLYADHVAAHPQAPWYLGLMLIGAGVVGLLIALWEYRWVLRYLWSAEFRAVAGVGEAPAHTPLLWITILLLLIGLFAFFAVLLRF